MLYLFKILDNSLTGIVFLIFTLNVINYIE